MPPNRAVRILFVLALAVLVPNVLNAQDYFLRVSFKRILNGTDPFPGNGIFTAVADLQQAVVDANFILERNDVPFRLDLCEIVNLDGTVPPLDQFVEMSASNPAIDALEEAAMADPETFHWKFNAINIYVIERLGDQNGLSSYPMTGEIIVFGNDVTAAECTSEPGTVLIHEIGHYLSLTHMTFDEVATSVAWHNGQFCVCEDTVPPTGFPLCGSLPGPPCSDALGCLDTETALGYNLMGGVGGTGNPACMPPQPGPCVTDCSSMSGSTVCVCDANFTECQVTHMLWEIEVGSRTFVASPTSPACGFLRGDADNDGATDFIDVTFILAYLFQNGDTPDCLDAADGNDSGFVELSDSTYLLNYLFQSGPPPPMPFPDCGKDEFPPDALGCDVHTCFE